MKYFVKTMEFIGIGMLNFCCFIISLLIPKNKDTMIVGGWFGDRFADNAKFLFLQNYKKLEKPEFKMFWIAGTDDVYNLLKKNNLPVVKRRSLKSIWLHFRARYHVIDQSHRSLLGFLSVRARRINLWHGVGIKRTYFVEPPRNKGRIVNLWYRVYRWLKLNTGGWGSVGRWDKQYLAVPTEYDRRELFAKCFPENLNETFYCSYPRNIYLNDIKNGHKDYNILMETELRDKNKIEKVKALGKKIVFYVPTFRSDELTFMGTDDKIKLRNFFELMRKENVVLVFKMHAFDRTVIEGSNNYINLSGNSDLTTFLGAADILITDYSSVFTDYLMIDRPEIFYVYDYKKYGTEDRGFLTGYDDFTPGRKIYDIEDLGKWIIRTVKNDFDDGYGEERSRILKLTHGSEIIDPFSAIRENVR